MAHNIRTLQGVAELTAQWEQLKERLFEFACGQEEDARWKDESFRNHMLNEYFRSHTPITQRLYSLDEKNQLMIIRFIEEELMRGLLDIIVE